MPQKPLEDRYVFLIFEFRRKGLSLDKIEEEMTRLCDKGEIEKSPARRTIANYSRRYDQLEPSIKLRDAPFELHKLDEYGIPWESSTYLLEVWWNVMSGKVFKQPDGDEEYVPTPTVRQVRWWWRVHLAVPELDILDTWGLAERFAYRELVSDLLGTPLDLEDLEAHLIYKPWEEGERLEIYRRHIAEGKIPSLRLWWDAASFFEPVPLLQGFPDPRLGAFPNWGFPEGEYSHFLLSQQLEMIHDQRMNKESDNEG